MLASPARQNGIVLIVVVVGLVVIASIALMLTASTGNDNALAAQQADSASLDYLVESGMEHAKWQLAQNTTCNGYTNIPTTNFGVGSYSVTVTPSSASPVTLSAVGTGLGGAQRTLIRDNVRPHEMPTTTVLQPGPEGDDAEIWQQGANNNYGDAAETWVSSASNDTTRSLLRFDMAAVPAGVTILDATLSLLRQSGSGTNQPVSAHRIRNQWNEDSVTWNSRESGTTWDTAGGDFDNTAIATTPVGPGNSRYEWNIAPLVQGWIDGSYPNYGVALVAAISGMSGHRFYTSDETNPGQRPSLSVTYACECGQNCASSGTLPIAHWKLDETGGLIAVDSEGGHDGTLVNNAAWFPGQIDGGIRLAGPDDYIDVPHDDSLSLTEGMTFSAWIATRDNGSGYRAIISKDISGNGQSNYWFGTFNDELAFGFWASGAFRSVQTSGLALQQNTWYHVAASFDNATDQVLLYLNGTQVHAGVIAFEPFPESANLWIGQSVDAEFWFGLLDDVRIYNTALSADEITTIAAPSGGSFYLDEFNAIAYSGSDGTLDWSGDWQESGESDGPTAGFLQVDNQADCASANCLRIGHLDSDVNQRIVSREADLSGIASWTMSYDFSTSGADRGFLHVEASGDGGSTWSPLTTYDFEGGDVSGSESFDLGSFFVSNSQIRFRLVNRGNDPGVVEQIRGLMFIDNVKIEPGGTDGGGSLFPLAHWRLDETGGTTAEDSIGGHNGTLANGPTWATGTVDGALDFDGANDYVDLTSDTELDDVFDGGATVMAWIQPAGWGENGYGRIFDKSSSPSSTDDGWVIRMNADNGGVINLGQGFTGGRGWWAIPNGSISLDAWQHIAVAYDSSSAANDPVIYVDGISLLVTEKNTPSGDFRSDASINLRMGNYAGGTTHTFDGRIDDARVYDRMLDASEVAGIAGGAGGGGACIDTVGDDFNSGGYDGNTGTLNWTTPWNEFNDSGGAASGDERVQTDTDQVALRVRDNDGGGEGVEREVDLSGYSNATLSIDYRRHNLDDSDDYVAVEVSGDGGGEWNELDRIEGAGSDDAYQQASYWIGDYLSANTRIRFITSSSMGGTDAVFFDNIEICVEE